MHVPGVVRDGGGGGGRLRGAAAVGQPFRMAEVTATLAPALPESCGR